MSLKPPSAPVADPIRSLSAYRPAVRRLRLGAVLVGLGAALLVVLVVGTALGPVGIDPVHSLGILLNRLGINLGLPFTITEQRIIEQLRLPRMLLAGLVGGSLAVVGTVFQALFRNPLADPGLTGVSSGGSLGAVLAIATGLQAIGIWTRPVLAFGFALLTALLVYGFSVSRGRVQLGALLLAGVAMGSFTSAAISAVLTFTQNNDLLREIVFWLLGSFINRGWEHFWLLVPLAGPGLIICLFYLRDLNLMLAGEDEASSLGVNVPQVRLILLVVTALITAGCVSVSGTISFVGLIVPHLARLLVGPDHRVLLPVSLLGGAVFLMLADTLARLLIQPQELPVGVITAFLGAPFFLSLLYVKRNQAGRI